MGAWIDTNALKTGWKCKCPKCREGDLYEHKYSMSLRSSCPICELDLSKNDVADGPAVFLIFILGFALVPLALILDAIFVIPLWVHGVVWTLVTLGLIFGTLRPLKAYILALQYKHLPWDTEETDNQTNDR